jgi:hypothetical protein
LLSFLARFCGENNCFLGGQGCTKRNTRYSATRYRSCRSPGWSMGCAQALSCRPIHTALLEGDVTLLDTIPPAATNTRRGGVRSIMLGKSSRTSSIVQARSEHCFSRPRRCGTDESSNKTGGASGRRCSSSIHKRYDTVDSQGDCGHGELFILYLRPHC